MIALRLHDSRDLRLHEEPVPAPADDELLVRVDRRRALRLRSALVREGAIGDVA